MFTTHVPESQLKLPFEVLDNFKHLPNSLLSVLFYLFYDTFLLCNCQFRAASFSSVKVLPLLYLLTGCLCFSPQEAVGRVCLKERGRDVLVLQRVKSSVTSPSDRPSPTSSGGGSREDDGDKRLALLRRYHIKPTRGSPPFHFMWWLGLV